MDTLSRSISETAWFGYSPTLSDEAIIALYTRRYGSPPLEVLRGRSIVLAGPVPNNSTSSEENVKLTDTRG